MIWGLIGATGWTDAYVDSMLVPRFWAALANRGKMLRPLVQALLDVKAVEGLHDNPEVSKGEKTPVQKVLDDYTDRKKGIIKPQDAKDRRFSQAVGIKLALYYGDPDKTQAMTAQPFPGMGAEEARDIMGFVNDGTCPPDTWAEQLLPAWDAIVAAAGQ